MDPLAALLHNYHTFHQETITNRFFKHADMLQLLEPLRSNPRFNVREAGKSFEGRAIHLIRCGSGPVKVFLWSQMHGNEATATMALMDLFNFLGSDEPNELKYTVLQHCTLYMMPMVSPDGAEVFNRRNAQEIDINRDFHRQQSPEGRLLRATRDKINPHFGFNLHDQTTMWSAGKSGKPATISLLAPAYDEALSVNEVRQSAMQVIADMNDTLQAVIPGHVGRFDDEHEPRAFGDNFQAAGTSTILIEAGGYAHDPEKQHIRKLVFLSMLSGLHSIARQSFTTRSLEHYFAIPENKLYHFQILLRNCSFHDATNTSTQAYRADVGLTVRETPAKDYRSMNYSYVLGDLGDLSNRFGYTELDCSQYTLIETQKLRFDEFADLVVMDGTTVLLAIENGIITSNAI